MNVSKLLTFAVILIFALAGIYLPPLLLRGPTPNLPKTLFSIRLTVNFAPSISKLWLQHWNMPDR